MACDFAIDSSGNFLREYNGFRVTASRIEYVAQKLQVKFRFFLGEWFRDTSVGIPYLTKVMEKGISMSYIESLYKAAILSLDEVEKLTAFSLEISAATRTLSVTFSCKLTDSDTTETVTVEV